MQMINQKILLERSGPLAVVKFNDTGHMNAMDDAMREQFVVVTNRLPDGDGVRAILLTGDGRAFCAGANLNNMFNEQSRGAVPDVGTSLRDFINPTLMRRRESGTPIVAAVNGAAVGVGCGIA
jgi:2-(1,2-epoxy-1,2-dihydrophenyl)acetyl-CoA isomerase